ncbi:DUF2971 domain-containing protein [Flavobacterium sp. IMCC34518]|uniref:DUF2971 domain-containing protein n=1 Tax=Flavobacterium sp. IMCC34518 TaxID=3003623 RepID=UPI0022ABD634|nr:DUF2971 domain-containing protein [Flavobacterium sp. IMCC34518]
MEKEKITNEILIEIHGNLLHHISETFSNNNKINKQFGHCEDIFHYTSINGFISIIETQSLYCTNVNFLNDSKELKHGIELILKALEIVKNSENNDIIESTKNNIEILNKTEKYVTCFSKDGDSLSQWRAYGNDGKGISLGFDFSGLKNNFNKNLTGLHIEYDERLQYEAIEEFIKIIIAFYNNIKSRFDWSEHDFNHTTSISIIRFLNHIIYSYKHPSFIDEKEYRLQFELKKNSKADILFRTSTNLIIPYTIIKNSYTAYLETKKPNETEPIFGIKKLPLNKIIIGPSLDYEIVKIGLEKFLIMNGYENIEIIKSNVPYRA